MSDKFTPCNIERLLQWILAEEKQGQIFGIRKELFFVPQSSDVFKMTRYGQCLKCLNCLKCLKLRNGLRPNLFKKSGIP